MGILIPILPVLPDLFGRSNETTDLNGFVNSEALQNDCSISGGATYKSVLL